MEVDHAAITTTCFTPLAKRHEINRRDWYERKGKRQAHGNEKSTTDTLPDDLEPH